MNSRKKKRRPQSARRRSSPRKMVRSPQKRRRNMRRPVSAVALSRKNNQKRAMKMRKSKSTQNGNLLKAARGGISSNKRGISKSRKQKMQTIKNNTKYKQVRKGITSVDFSELSTEPVAFLAFGSFYISSKYFGTSLL